MKRFEYYDLYGDVYYDLWDRFYFLNNCPDYNSKGFFCSFTSPDGSVWEFGWCDICGDFFPVSKLEKLIVEGEDRIVCKYCMDMLFWCDGCEQYIPEEKLVMSDGYTMLCEKCAKDYVYCAVCEGIIHIDYAYYDSKDNPYCEWCWEEREEEDDGQE